MNYSLDRFAMIKKYNIAYIPVSHIATIINLARHFSPIADRYLLGEHSLPHVTLYQFTMDDSEIENVWEKITFAFNETHIKLTFDEFSCITFDHETYWASLLPNNYDVLIKMHHLVANILKMPINNAYDPHMTLMNTKNKKYESEVEKLKAKYVPVTDIFTLALGECDAAGQLIKILYFM